MASFAQIQTTGIYPNEETQCYEAWLVDGNSGNKVLVATCSMCVPVDQLRWWEHQVWNVWIPEWEGHRLLSRVA